MSDPCAREAQFGEKTYPLNLNHPWVRKVLSVRGLYGPNGNTPAACMARFQTETYSSEDIERVIELGLIGGGLSESDTEAVLDEHVRGKPLANNVSVAVNALLGLFVGSAQS